MSLKGRGTVTLVDGDIVRLLADTDGFRASAIYAAISIPAGAYAVVRSRQDFWVKAAVLQHVKARGCWVPTKVIVSLRDRDRRGSGDRVDILDAYHGEDVLWERPSAVDLLGMLAPCCRDEG